MESKFIQNLNSIKEDLNNHKRNKSELMIKLIEERLAGSLQNYYNELNNTVNRLTNYNATKLDRNLNENNRYIRRFE